MKQPRWNGGNRLAGRPPRPLGEFRARLWPSRALLKLRSVHGAFVYQEKPAAN